MFFDRLFGVDILLFHRHAVGGAQYDELGAAVQLVARLLLLLIGKGLDELLGQHVAFLEEGIFLRELSLDGLGLLLAVAYGREAVFGDAVLYEVVHHALGTPLRQSLVVGLGTAVVGMGRQLDGDVGVLVEHPLGGRRTAIRLPSLREGHGWAFFLKRIAANWN